LGLEGTLSSARIASPGNAAASTAQMRSLASRSARVTGSFGPFISTANGVAYTDMMRALALRAMAMASSSSRVKEGVLIA